MKISQASIAPSRAKKKSFKRFQGIVCKKVTETQFLHIFYVNYIFEEL